MLFNCWNILCSCQYVHLYYLCLEMKINWNLKTWNLNIGNLDYIIQARKKLWKTGVRILHKVRRQPRKSRKSWKSWCGGGGGTLSVSKKLGNLSRHGVGVSSYITNLYKHESNKTKQILIQKGGAVAPNAPPPPSDGPVMWTWWEHI